MRDVVFVEDGKLGLRRVTGELLVPALFDSIPERYYFVAERNGKKGLLDDSNGDVVVPCEMDEFYEQIDTDGIIPFNKGEKWGMLHFGVSSGAVFDDIDIGSEQYAKAKIGDEWFFVGGDGKPTKKEHEAWFGSW